MNVYEIQTVVLESLRAAAVPKVFRMTIYSLSNEAAEAGQRGGTKKNRVFVEFLASFDEYMDFRERCKQRGVYVSGGWEAQDGSIRFIYRVNAVEFDR